jgi:hypothetical protein
MVWCSDISPARSVMSTARVSSILSAICWPRESMLSAPNVSAWRSTPSFREPGMTRTQPFSGVLSAMAIQAPTTWSGWFPQ